MTLLIVSLVVLVALPLGLHQSGRRSLQRHEEFMRDIRARWVNEGEN